jgi:hypothetical protein
VGEKKSTSIPKSTTLDYSEVNLSHTTNSPAVNVACTHKEDLHGKSHATPDSLGLIGRQAKMSPNVMTCSITETPKKKSSLCLNSGRKETKKV